LRHAGGNHIERVRVALGHGDFTALQVIVPLGWSCWPGFYC
jgi:hypothetical protein